jgi:hypothetical protein
MSDVTVYQNFAKKIQEAGTTRYGRDILEYLDYQIKKCRDGLESVTDIQDVSRIQGGITQLRSLKKLLTSSTSSVEEIP